MSYQLALWAGGIAAALYLFGGRLAARLRALVVEELRLIIKGSMEDNEIKREIGASITDNIVRGVAPTAVGISGSSRVAARARELALSQAVVAEVNAVVSRVVVDVAADEDVFDAVWRIGGQAGKLVANNDASHEVVKDIIAKSATIAMQDKALQASLNEIVKRGLSDEAMHANCVTGAYKVIRRAIISAMSDEELREVAKQVTIKHLASR